MSSVITYKRNKNELLGRMYLLFTYTYHNRIFWSYFILCKSEKFKKNYSYFLKSNTHSDLLLTTLEPSINVFNFLHSVRKNGTTLCLTNSHFLVDCINFSPVETEINTPQAHVIYLLDSLMTYLRRVASQDSVTVVYMLKLTILDLKINFW